MSNSVNNAPSWPSAYRLSAEMKLKTSKFRQPKCIVIAGPNGAGKTTFAREFLPKEAEVLHFVNADLIASGLSPLRPEIASISAGKLALAQLDRLAKTKVDLAFESTLSGLTYASRFKAWKAQGYRIEIAYLWIDSARLSLRRIAARVKEGGHNVPRKDALRRFDRSWENFIKIYRPLANSETVYDNSGESPKLAERTKTERQAKDKRPDDFVKKVGIALKRAAKNARKTARMHGLPIYVSKNGKVVAIKP